MRTIKPQSLGFGQGVSDAEQRSKHAVFVAMFASCPTAVRTGRHHQDLAPPPLHGQILVTADQTGPVGSLQVLLIMNVLVEERKPEPTRLLTAPFQFFTRLNHGFGFPIFRPPNHQSPKDGKENLDHPGLNRHWRKVSKAL